MTKQKLFLTFIIFFLTVSVFSQTKYACFENDKNKNLKITAVFNKFVFGFYKLLFGGHKAPIGSINIIGRQSNTWQTPFRRSGLLFIWK